MAALFDLDDQPRSERADAGADTGAAGRPGGGGFGDLSSVGRSFQPIVAELLDMAPASAIREIAGFRAQLTAAETVILGGVIDRHGDTRRAENLAASSGTASRRQAKKAARRAKAAKASPGLIDKMAAGMSGEQIDVVVEAAEQTNGAAADDDEFIDAVAKTDPDQAHRIKRRFIKDKTNAAKAETRHQRQRRNRSVSRFITDGGLDALLLKGDTASIDQIHKTLTQTANQFYRDDGGRDAPIGKQPRTSTQRMYDAAFAHITSQLATTTSNATGAGSAGTGQFATRTTATTGSGFAGSGPTSPPGAGSSEARESRQTGSESNGTRGTRPAAQPTPGSSDSDPAATRAGSARPAGTRGPTASKRFTPPKARAVVFIGVTVEKYLGLAPDQAAQLIGTGPIADTVLNQYLDADPELIGIIYGQHGMPLWLGRSERYATEGQVRALIARDHGCVLCGASHQHCQAHHTPPWAAPRQGQTDIDKLVLLCQSCHHALHANNQTVYHDAVSGNWKRRPATAAETPPQRLPRHHQHRPGRGVAPQRE